MGVEGGIPEPDLPPGPDPAAQRAAPQTPPGSCAPCRAPNLGLVASCVTDLNQPSRSRIFSGSSKHGFSLICAGSLGRPQNFNKCILVGGRP